MLIISIMVLSAIFIIISFFAWIECYGIWEKIWGTILTISLILLPGLFMFGELHGYINYLPTEGTHQGFITAVDLEGIYFRRYEVYLKSNGYVENGDETKYLIYDYEEELAKELKENIGKEVKLHYGHDGGYIPWNSCGTTHIKSIEVIEEEE